MKQVLHDRPEFVLGWMSAHLDYVPLASDYHAIGLLDGGKLTAGAFFDRWTGHDVVVHLVCTKPATRAFIKACVEYAFIYLKVARVTAYIADGNEKSCKITEQVGFEREGVMRRACPDGKDKIVYGLLPEKAAKWLRSR